MTVLAEEERIRPPFFTPPSDSLFFKCFRSYYVLVAGHKADEAMRRGDTCWRRSQRSYLRKHEPAKAKRLRLRAHVMWRKGRRAFRAEWHLKERSLLRTYALGYNRLMQAYHELAFAVLR